ncbi:MAG: hypothetical protein ACTS9Y_00660 [Methylophilus sp.]|uniref:hypothetical protein n=1 Tax=Methylophilus sp. TaxID=29541 RepID=UPI003FA00B8A
MLARLNGDPNLLSIAQNVYCLMGASAYTVEDILLECNILGVFRPDFAGWVDDTDYVLKSCMGELTGCAREAFEYVAQKTFYSESKIAKALATIREQKKTVELLTSKKTSHLQITYMRYDQ